MFDKADPNNFKSSYFSNPNADISKKEANSNQNNAIERSVRKSITGSCRAMIISRLDVVLKRKI